MKKLKCCFVMLLLISTNNVFAQEPDDISGWVNAGVGFYISGIDGNINANLAVNNLLFTVKLTSGGTIFRNSFEEKGFLAGYLFKTDETKISIAGGLAQCKFSESSGGFFSPVKKTEAIGFITELQYYYCLWDFLGIGWSISGNINKEKSQFGVNLNLFLGKLD